MKRDGKALMDQCVCVWGGAGGEYVVVGEERIKSQHKTLDKPLFVCLEGEADRG